MSKRKGKKKRKDRKKYSYQRNVNYIDSILGRLAMGNLKN